MGKNKIFGYGLVVKLCISENLIKPSSEISFKSIATSLYSAALYTTNYLALLNI